MNMHLRKSANWIDRLIMKSMKLCWLTELNYYSSCFGEIDQHTSTNSISFFPTKVPFLNRIPLQDDTTKFSLWSQEETENSINHYFVFTILAKI